MTAAVYVAFLRGINVGGKNKLPMKDLAAMFTDAGCDDVQTYIQSGNVIFRARKALARRISALISENITDRFGYQIPVVTRSVAEIRKTVDSNPFIRAGADPERLHVAFLARRPPAAKLAELHPNRSPPDEFIVHGREIYLQCPGGMARTKLTNAYFDSKLGTTSTMRNWNTVLKLAENSRVPSVPASTRSSDAAEYRERISDVLKRTRPRLASTHVLSFKKCFGAIAGYVDENIFISSGRFGIALKLPATTIDRLMAEDGAQHLKYFPKGHVKRDYVVLPRQILEDPHRLKKLVDRSIRFVTHE